MNRLTILLLCAALLAAPQRPVAGASVVRRVNAPRFEASVDWNSAAIFWFGQVGWSGSAKSAPVPGRNYADVRVAYTPQALHVFVSVIDYYLWANTSPQAADDLTQYDALELYIDTQGDRSATPQADDYRFLSGWRYGDQNDPRWHRQARGSGGAWDTAWGGAWTDRPGSQWAGNGPNDNGGNIDFGWANTLSIPWSTLGLSGPPDGATLGMALRLYDRDDRPPAGAGTTQAWPEGASGASPATWGELHLGLAARPAPFATIEGSATVRRGLAGSQVLDATVGSDGNCSGGHNGDPDGANMGAKPELFVESQAAITDFPCFSRSYLRFGLGQVPSGKVIIDAKLTLHHWGNSGNPGSSNPGDRPQPSLIQLLSVDGGWSETGVTWNNGPLARENLGGTTVQPVGSFPGWPGVAYTWDATAAVAAAYAAGEPLDIALYTADTNMHSSKYFSASEVGDWDAVGRPTLVVTWGVPAEVRAQAMLPFVVR